MKEPPWTKTIVRTPTLFLHSSLSPPDPSTEKNNNKEYTTRKQQLQQEPPATTIPAVLTDHYHCNKNMGGQQKIHQKNGNEWPNLNLVDQERFRSTRVHLLSSSKCRDRKIIRKKISFQQRKGLDHQQHSNDFGRSDGDVKRPGGNYSSSKYRMNSGGRGAWFSPPTMFLFYSVMVLQLSMMLFISPAMAQQKNPAAGTPNAGKKDAGGLLPAVLGLRVQTEEDDEHDKTLIGYTEKGEVRVSPDKDVTIVLFGTQFKSVKTVYFVGTNGSCPDGRSKANNGTKDGGESTREGVSVFKEQLQNELQFVHQFPSIGSRFICLLYNASKLTTTTAVPASSNKDLLSTAGPFRNEMTVIQVENAVRTYVLSNMYLQICVVGGLLVLSGLFSGLNLGLMSLDPNELEIIIKAGSPNEQRYASTILPVRKTGNYLLCSLLFGNVVVNAAISILFDDLTSGLVALVVSSLGIVLFGEIVPQSICNRKGLAVGAYTIYLTKFFMLFTSPLSWPVGKLLDLILGEEVGKVYDKSRMAELIKMTAAQGESAGYKAELQIMTGALAMSEKTVSDVMTSIDDVFMISSKATLNVKLVADVVQNGYTRVPVYDGDRNNVVALLNVKDLALLDPDDNLSVETVCGYWQYELRFVNDDTPLNVIFDEFKRGHYHMAFVQKVEYQEDKDPNFLLLGIVTLEDVIEEIIQAEIMDETDVITDNVKRNRRKDTQIKDLSKILDAEQSLEGSVSIQLQLACIQWLSSNMRPFSEDLVTHVVLQRLVKNYLRQERPSQVLNETLGGLVSKNVTAKHIYKKGDASERFVLILEGRMEVTIGEGDLNFEAGPFHCFGKEVMEKMMTLAPKGTKSGAAFVPDFTATIRSDVVYLVITAQNYWDAYRASLIERGRSLPERNNQFSPLLSPSHSPTTTAVTNSNSLVNSPMDEAGGGVGGLHGGGVGRGWVRGKVVSESHRSDIVQSARLAASSTGKRIGSALGNRFHHHGGGHGSGHNSHHSTHKRTGSTGNALITTVSSPSANRNKQQTNSATNNNPGGLPPAHHRLMGPRQSVDLTLITNTNGRGGRPGSVTSVASSSGKPAPMSPTSRTMITATATSSTNSPTTAAAAAAAANNTVNTPSSTNNKRLYNPPEHLSIEDLSSTGAKNGAGKHSSKQHHHHNGKDPSSNHAANNHHKNHHHRNHQHSESGGGFRRGGQNGSSTHSNRSTISSPKEARTWLQELRDAKRTVSDAADALSPASPTSPTGTKSSILSADGSPMALPDADGGAHHTPPVVKFDVGGAGGATPSHHSSQQNLIVRLNDRKSPSDNAEKL